MKAATLVFATILLAACNEIPQDAKKSFAPKQEVQLYDNERFGGDKDRFEKALAERAQNENEHVRLRDLPE